MLEAVTKIVIRFNDCDPMGHTNNATYFTYMEQARVVLFARVFGLKEDAPIREINFPFILAEISCRFLKPTYANETVIVRAAIAELKNSSFTIGYDLSRIRAARNTRQPPGEGSGQQGQAWLGRAAKSDDFAESVMTSPDLGGPLHRDPELVEGEREGIEKVAEGKSVQVWFDYKAGKPIRIPDDIRRIMEG